MNKLFVIATPIGNIDDVSKNTIKTLENVDYLFCEDTRVSKKLLTLLNIKNQPKLISHHKFNEKANFNELISIIKNHCCGLISDAGYPTICDPGFNLIKECHKNNINVHVINGPSALMHAIVQSGFNSHGFVFIGFLDKNKNQIVKQLNCALSSNLPVVCFESVHRINQLIQLIKTNFSNHWIYLGRELTKKFESYVVCKGKDLLPQIEKGEFCLIIHPLLENKNNDANVEKQALTEINELINVYNMRSKDACKYIAKKYGLETNKVYKEITKK